MCGMKAQRQADSVAALAGQPGPSAVLLSGVAGERLTSGVRSVSVVGMSRKLTRKSRGGGGHYCLAWRFRGSVCAASRLEGFEQSTEGLNNEGVHKFSDGFCGFAGKSVSLRLDGQLFRACLGVLGFWGCLADRPCCCVGLFRTVSDYAFHFAGLPNTAFYGGAR